MGELADVSIAFGDVPERLDACEYETPVFQVSARAFLLDVPWLGRARVEHGRDITLAWRAEAPPDRWRSLLTGPLLGAAQHQRGRLPLHASAVAAPNGCAAFFGPSGIGKSTLVAALVGRGHDFVSDEICGLDVGDRTVTAYPGSPHHLLWADVAAGLGHDAAGLTRVEQHLDKYRVAPRHLTRHLSLPLTALYEIVPVAAAQMPQVTPVEAGLRFEHATRAVYRPAFVAGRMPRERLFHHLTCVASLVPLFRLEVPAGPAGLAATIDALEQSWR